MAARPQDKNLQEEVFPGAQAQVDCRSWCARLTFPVQCTPNVPYPCASLFVTVVVLETGSFYVVQTGFKIPILPQLPKCGVYRQEPLHPARPQRLKGGAAKPPVMLSVSQVCWVPHLQPQRTLMPDHGHVGGSASPHQLGDPGESSYTILGASVSSSVKWRRAKSTCVTRLW